MRYIYALITTLFINFSQSNPVEGLWITQDDETGKKKSEVLLYEEDGKLYGKIIKLLLPEDQGKICINCKGENKGKLMAGLVIVKDLELEDDVWEDGTILDPKSGKLYDCFIALEKKDILKVRGYYGFSLLGRTQTWIRKEN